MLSPRLRVVASLGSSALPWLLALAAGLSIHMWREPSRTSITIVTAANPPERECEREPRDAVECYAEHTCVVQRESADVLLREPGSLSRHARFVPSERAGAMQGIALYGIRRGSLLRELGFDNGDIITHVNDEAITSLDRAMSVAMSLRYASSVRVTRLRNDVSITKQIEIR